MIQALNMPYSSKRDEIMSRYRPIAPKPELSTNNGSGTNGPSTSIEGPLVPEKFRQSPYLQNIWSHLQARPTRTRKRGRTAGISPVSMLRKQHEHQQQQLLRYQQQQQQQQQQMHASSLSLHAFGMYGSDQHARLNNVNANNNNNNKIVELPLLSCSLLSSGETKAKAIDFSELNSLKESDLLLQLQIPNNNNNNNVISPRPVRPVGSTISIVGPIGDDLEAKPVAMSAEKLEEDVEVELLPAVISDRGNKVRMVNSAYKELVGQPECPWLDSMMVNSRSGKRISGEVMFRFEGLRFPMTSNGFSCWVRIEWESDEGKKKNNVNAFCEVVRLVCESKDYVFYWRFHTREVSPSLSKV